MSKVYPTVVGKHGYTYYQIPKDEIFYRGDTGIYLSRGALPKSPSYFSKLKKRVKPYGLAFTFRTKKDLNLLALDLPTENNFFYESSPENIKKILVQQFGFLSGIRDTVHSKDYELLNYLCDVLKIDGYYNNEMNVRDDVPIDFEDDGKNDTDPSKFHSEMGLCNLPANIELVNYRKDLEPYSQAQIESAVAEKRSIDQKYEMERLRGKKSRSRFDEFPSSESEFDDPFGHFPSGSESESESSAHSTKSTSSNQALFSPGKSSSSVSQGSPSSSLGSPTRDTASGQNRKFAFGNLFSSPIREGSDEDERYIPRNMSNAELRLANEISNDRLRTESNLRTTTPTNKRGTPIGFDLDYDIDFESIASPLKKAKKSTPKKTDGSTGGLRRKKTIRRKKSRFSKKTKKRKIRSKNKKTRKKRKQSKKRKR